MASKRNKLQHLVDQIEALPRQTELKQIRVQLSTIADRVGQKTAELSKSFGKLGALREVQSQPDLMQQVVEQRTKSLRVVVASLEQQVRSSGQQQRISAALDTLSNVSQSLANDIANVWTDADNELLATTQALIALTATYDPSAQATLQQALERFKAVRAPSEASAVANYQKARNDLLNARLALNPPGEVGAFLSDALRGIGSVKMLSNPKVQSFLDEHPVLWTKLAVKLS